MIENLLITNMTNYTSTVTIKGRRSITTFLIENPKTPYEAIIDSNVDLVFNCASRPSKSTSSYKGYANTFTYDNKFTIVESIDMVQIIYQGSIIIDQNIAVQGKTLTIMSFNGSVTIEKGVTLQANAINIFAKNGNIQNNGTLDTSSVSGNVNLFAKTIDQGMITYGLGSLLVNSSLSQMSLPTPNCTDQLTLSGILFTFLGYSLNGTLQLPISLTTNKTTNFKGGHITVDTTAKIITIIYSGTIVITGNLDFSAAVSGYSITIITPCDFNALTNNLISGADLSMLVGGNITSGSLVTAQDGGQITITLGGSIETTGHASESILGDNVSGAWAGIGGKGGSNATHGTSVGSITLTIGKDLIVTGGKTSSPAFNYAGTGSAIGGGGGGSAGHSGNGADGGSSGTISIIVGGKVIVSGGIASSSYDQEGGGAAGIGGGGAGGTQGLDFHGGKGGDALGNITLISGSDVVINGSNVRNIGNANPAFTDGGAGSGIGSGGAGGNYIKGGAGNNGGSVMGNITLTIAGALDVEGGSSQCSATGNSGGAGSGIGAGGGSYQNGTSNPITGAITVISQDDISISGGNTKGSGTFNGAGAASGIGGAGGASTSFGPGGNGGDGANSFIQLISFYNMLITGGTATATNGALNSAGNGASIGGGGGGGTDGPSQGGTGGQAGVAATIVVFGSAKLVETSSGTGKDGKSKPPFITKYPRCPKMPCFHAPSEVN